MDSGALLEPLLPATAMVSRENPPLITAIVAAPLGTCPVWVRGGRGLAVQRHALTSSEARRTPWSLLLATDARGRSEGDLYIDDGETPAGPYSLLKLNADVAGGGLQGNVSSLVLHKGYDPADDAQIARVLGLEEVVVMGMDAHALQGRTIVASFNRQPFPPGSVYFDPFTSTLRFWFGEDVDRLRQRVLSIRAPGKQAPATRGGRAAGSVGGSASSPRGPLPSQTLPPGQGAVAGLPMPSVVQDVVIEWTSLPI